MTEGYREEVTFVLCFDWWVGRIGGGGTFFNSLLQMQIFGYSWGKWLVGGPTTCAIVGLLTRSNGHSIAKCLQSWVYLSPEATNGEMSIWEARDVRLHHLAAPGWVPPWSSRTLGRGMLVHGMCALGQCGTAQL